VKIECACALGPKRFSVTDARLYCGDDLAEVEPTSLERMRSSLADPLQVLLCVGLGRAWAPAGAKVHWMQVNGIHAVDGTSVRLPDSDALFERLRRLRKELAAERNLPAYVVFHDAALREMAERRPTSRGQMLEIRGVGSRKLDEYGDVFLAEIAAFDED
jgi:superfamily II DNA helicase RecQ